MKTRLRLILATIGTCACLAASAKQWTVIDGEVVGRADPNRVSVVVISVDGKADFDAPMTKTLTPGFHYLQLASTRQNTRGSITTVPYAFMAEPCRLYTVYAQYESERNRSPWQLVITKQDKPLGGCTMEQPKPPATPPPQSPTSAP